MHQPLTPPAFIAEPTQPVRRTRSQKLGSLLLILICLEVGAFLLLFPWMKYWDHSSFASISPWMRDVWDSNYFRGALSGLGIVNVYIAVAECFRLRNRRPDRLKVSVL